MESTRTNNNWGRRALTASTAVALTVTAALFAPSPVSADQGNTAPPPPASGAAVDIESYVNGLDADLPPGPTFEVGETLVFTYVVTNVGDSPLVNVRAGDMKFGMLTCPATSLDPGETMECEPNSEIAAEVGQVRTLTGVAGDDPDGVEVLDRDWIKYQIVAPADSSIDIEKAVNGEDADDPPGPSVEQGATVEFTYVVTNTGNTPLTILQVGDSSAGDLNCPQTSLEPGAAMDCEPDSEVAADLGPVFSRAGVLAADPTGARVSDIDPVNYLVVGGGTPAIDLEMFINGLDADEPPGPTVFVGTPLTFTYVVTNTGETSLVDIVVVDATLGTITCPVNTLEPGESTECGPEIDSTLEPGPTVRTSDVTGNSPSGVTVTDSDPVNFEVFDFG